MGSNLQVILVIAITCGSIGGIVVASILKLLDNVVKVRGLILDVDNLYEKNKLS